MTRDALRCAPEQIDELAINAWHVPRERTQLEAFSEVKVTVWMAAAIFRRDPVTDVRFQKRN